MSLAAVAAAAAPTLAPCDAIILKNETIFDDVCIYTYIYIYIYEMRSH